MSKCGLVRGTWVEARREAPYPAEMTKHSPVKYFKTSPEIIRLAVMLYFSSWQVGFQSRLYQPGFKLEADLTRSMS